MKTYPTFRSDAINPAVRDDGLQPERLQAAPMEQVQRLAYEIWQREGRPENRERANWLEAEAEIRAGNKFRR